MPLTSRPRTLPSAMRATSAACVLTCLCVPLAAGSVAAQAAPPDRSAQVDELLDTVTAGDAPGAAILVVRDGKVLHRKGYGLANIEHGAPNTPKTIFRIGSITKPFTALAILQLRDKGALQLDDPVTKYLPAFPHGDEITLRHLLTHTSGIPTSPELPPEFAPGERMAYSNRGYQQLGRIIEEVSGISYEEYLRANVFGPLGMDRTGYDHHATILKGRAAGYSMDEAGNYINAEFINMAGPWAAGGLHMQDSRRARFDLPPGTLMDVDARGW